MACEYTCDGCGKKEPAADYNGKYHKPEKWYQRGDDFGIQDACSRECIEVIAEKTGKTKVVMPF